MVQDFSPNKDYAGGQVLVGIQTNLYTAIAAGACKNVRFETIDSMPTDPNLTKQQAQHGKRNDADYSDPYIPHKLMRADAFSFTTKIRKSANDGAIDPVEVTFLESAGYEVVENAAGTVQLYTPATGVLQLSADLFGSALKNVAVLTQLDGGAGYYPTLFSTYDGVDSGTCAVKLPSTPTPGNVVQRMYTCVPMTPDNVIPVNKLLTFHVLGRGPSFQYTGCSLSGIEISEITPGGDITIKWTFHVADVASGSQAMAADDFQDGSAEMLIHGASIHLADYSAAATLAEVIVNRLKFNIPYKTLGLPGVGNTTTVLNEIQGYRVSKSSKESDDSPVLAEIDHIYDTQGQTDYDAVTAKALQVLKVTTALTTPALLLAIPKMIYNANPLTEEDDDTGCYMSKGVFRGTSPAWDVNNDPAKRGNRDFAFCLSGSV